MLTKNLLNSSAISSESVIISQFSFCNLFGAGVLVFLFVKSFASQIFLALFLFRVKKF